MIRAALLLAAVACSNGQTGAPAPPPPSPEAPRAHGTVVKARFKSDALGVSKNLVIYLPAGYAAAPDLRYPVFYYLHGLGGDETDWVEGGKLDAAADALALEAIVVMPDGDDSFYADSAKPVDLETCLAHGAGLLFPERPRRATCVRASQYETYITRDLIGWIDATYRTIATRDGRAIAGLSMGGFGALSLGMRHPELFAAAASHSGVNALLYDGPFPYERGKVRLATDVSSWGGRLGPFGAWMRGIFGPDLATWTSYDPAALARTVEPGRPALYLDCGTEDEFALQAQTGYLHDLLAERRIEHELYLGPGHHNFAFWRARLPTSLAFLRTKTARPQAR